MQIEEALTKKQKNKIVKIAKNIKSLDELMQIILSSDLTALESLYLQELLGMTKASEELKNLHLNKKA